MRLATGEGQESHDPWRKSTIAHARVYRGSRIDPVPLGPARPPELTRYGILSSITLNSGVTCHLLSDRQQHNAQPLRIGQALLRRLLQVLIAFAPDLFRYRALVISRSGS